MIFFLKKLFYFIEVIVFREKHYVAGIVFHKHKSLVYYGFSATVLKEIIKTGNT